MLLLVISFGCQSSSSSGSSSTDGDVSDDSGDGSDDTTILIGHTEASYSGSTGSSGDIPVHIYYPASSAGDDTAISDGQFPVIIFAHGYQQSYADYQYVWEELVPESYIMVFPDKLSDSASIDIDEYALDLNFLMNKMQELNDDSTSIFYNHVATKTALMGHSTGGGASYIASVNSQSGDNHQPVTIISLAALGNVYATITGTNPADITSQVDIPTLTMAGNEDCVCTTTDHAQPIYSNIPSTETKSLVTVTEGDHCGFSYVSGPGLSACQTAETTSCFPSLQGSTMSVSNQNALTLLYLPDWLDYFLKSESAAWDRFKTALDDSRITNSLNDME